MIKHFYEQTIDDDIYRSIELDENGKFRLTAGVISYEKLSDGNKYYEIGWETRGAKDTFSLGQPIYNMKGDLLGYIGVVLDDFCPQVNEVIEKIKTPSTTFVIMNPTEHCKPCAIMTYWQKNRDKVLEWELKQKQEYVSDEAIKKIRKNCFTFLGRKKLKTNYDDGRQIMLDKDKYKLKHLDVVALKECYKAGYNSTALYVEYLNIASGEIKTLTLNDNISKLKELFNEVYEAVSRVQNLNYKLIRRLK